jgi:hypothetical protein
MWVIKKMLKLTIELSSNDIMKTYPQKIIINRSCLKKGGRYGWSRPNQKD